MLGIASSQRALLAMTGWQEVKAMGKVVVASVPEASLDAAVLAVAERGLEGRIGHQGIEQAFCRVVQKAVREGAVGEDEVLTCVYLQSGLCRLAGCLACLLLVDEPERHRAWQIARRSVALEGERSR